MRPIPMKTKTVSVPIQVSPEAVYAYASNPENLPEWAPGLCLSISRISGSSNSGDEWLIESPGGPIRFRFVERNAFGVLDHIVRLSSGEEIYNPMRVIPNGTGSEVIFTVFQAPEMTDEAFEIDARTIERDLNSLKRVVEALPEAAEEKELASAP